MHEQRHEGIRGRRLPFLVVTGIFGLAGWICAVGQPIAKPPAPSAKLTPRHDAYGRLPLSFEENRGQTDPRVKFLARGNGYSLFLTSTDVVLKLREPSVPIPPRGRIPVRSRFGAIRIRLKDANPRPEIRGVEALAGKSSYFVGRDPKKWHTDIPTFAGVRLWDIYPGINLVYRGDQGRLEYDLEVAAVANPGRIKLEIEGARKLSLDAGRNLVISTAAGDVVQHAPLIYQSIAGQKNLVSGGYVLEDARTVAFKLGAYDPRRALIIDPLLTYASYLGGTGGDQGVSIAVDQNDASAWVTGTTTSTDFPVTPDAFQTVKFGNSDIFMTKVSPDGSGVIYSTYAGGSNADQASGIAVDPSGNAYATGLTLSSDFPVTGGAFQLAFKGTQDAFVVALDRNGGLIYSTLLGIDAAGAAIAVDSAGEASVVGTTRSANFPTTSGAFQSNYPGSIPNPLVGFVTKLNSIGTGLVFSTFMGLSDGGWPNAVALDSSSNTFISGGTYTGLNFNTQSCAPLLCGFVVELDTSGSVLDFSDVFPFATLYGIAIDSADDAHVVGTRGGPLLINLDSAGNPTFAMLSLGGNPTRIAIGPADNIFLSGVTSSLALAVTPGAYQSTYGGGGDAFVSVLNSTGFYNLYTTYLGGSGLDTAQGVAVDSAENAYVTGTTQSNDFPITEGVFEGENPGGGNGLAFIARIVPVLQSPTATVTITATAVATPVPTVFIPPTPSATRTPLPTHSNGATPIATSTIIMTPIPTSQGGGTATPTVVATPTETATSTITATPTPTPGGSVRIGPPGINFRKVRLGKSSGLRTVALVNPHTNKGPATITAIALQSQISAQAPTGFAVQISRSTCAGGGSIALGKGCKIFVTFAPVGDGTVIDSLVITGNFSNSGQPVALIGTGK
jgi:hypothetical protein